MAFPVNDKSKLETILLQEGYNINAGGAWSGTITSSNQANIFSLAPNDSGPYLFINPKITLSATESVSLYSSMNGDATGEVASVLSGAFVPKNCQVSFSFDNYIHPLGSNWSLYADSTQAGTAVKIGSTFSAIRMLNDFNFNAPRKIYWMGDSITAFTANAIGNRNYYQFQVRDWCAKKYAQGFRLTQKAWGGKTSTSFNNLLTYGSLYVDEPTLIFYQLGVNDSSQSIGTTLYRSNIDNMIAYKKAFWPNAIMVFLGSTPTQQTLRNTNLDAYRTAMAASVTAAADPNVKFLNLATSFDRTATPSTIWATSDVPATNTDCLHPGTLISHTGIANTITSYLDSLNLQF
jgi:lysophospholipase L1-like esterase